MGEPGGRGADPVSPVAGLLLLGFSIYLFITSIQLMQVKDVATSLLAALIGFVSLSGGVTLIRTWSLARAYSGGLSPGKGEGGGEEKR